MERQTAPTITTTFGTPLGWMAMVGRGDKLLRLTFGYRSADAAMRALGKELTRTAIVGIWNTDLVRLVEAFAAGDMVDFRQVLLDLGHLTPFRRKVVLACQKVPYGKSITYGQLAAKAGSRRAARAVGNCMARNEVPLVVPCHRVLPTGGKLGRFSAPGGVRTKRLLLAMEQTGLEEAGR